MSEYSYYDSFTDDSFTSSGYDPLAAHAEGWEWQDASTGLWDASIGLHDAGDEFWIDGDYEAANQMYAIEYQVEDLSDQAYDASWDAWYGPVNAEGYTAYDASIGYTSMDTSLIEPASSAGSWSMISDGSGESFL